MQTPTHPAAVACEFMTRAPLKGAEVEAYAQSFNWLQSILTGEIVVTPKGALEALQDKAKSFDEAQGKQKRSRKKPS